MGFLVWETPMASGLMTGWFQVNKLHYQTDRRSLLLYNRSDTSQKDTIIRIWIIRIVWLLLILFAQIAYTLLYVLLVENVIVFVLVDKNVLVHLAKQSDNPPSGLHWNPLASTLLQLCSAQNTAKSQRSNREQEQHVKATSNLTWHSSFWVKITALKAEKAV